MNIPFVWHSSRISVDVGLDFERFSHHEKRSGVGLVTQSEKRTVRHEQSESYCSPFTLNIAFSCFTASKFGDHLYQSTIWYSTDIVCLQTGP